MNEMEIKQEFEDEDRTLFWVGCGTWLYTNRSIDAGVE